MMPGMDGPTTFRELRKNPATAKIPVLLLTAKVQSSDQRRFADLGVEAVLFKPFDPLTLADADRRRAGLELTVFRAMNPIAQPGRQSQPRPILPRRSTALGPLSARDSRNASACWKQQPQPAPPISSRTAQREAAHAAAHKLAGTLGTFNLARGTELAREFELLFSAEPRPCSCRPAHVDCSRTARRLSTAASRA